MVTNISKMIPARKEINLKKVESESSDAESNSTKNETKSGDKNQT